MEVEKLAKFWQSPINRGAKYECGVKLQSSTNHSSRNIETVMWPQISVTLLLFTQCIHTIPRTQPINMCTHEVDSTQSQDTQNPVFGPRAYKLLLQLDYQPLDYSFPTATFLTSFAVLTTEQEHRRTLYTVTSWSDFLWQHSYNIDKNLSLLVTDVC